MNAKLLAHLGNGEGTPLKNELFLRKILDLASRTLDLGLSLLIPFYDSRIQRKSICKDGIQDQAGFLLEVAKKCLIWNLSFLFEPSFRVSTLRILESWAKNGIQYDQARESLNHLITRRNPISKKLVPSWAISQVLVSFGFFSSASILNSKALSVTASSLLQRLATLMANHPVKARKVLLAGEYLRSAQSEKMEIKLLEAISESSQSSASREKKCLIIGPGPTSLPSDLHKYDEVVILVGPNSSLENSLDMVKKIKYSVYINYEMTTLILEGQVDQGWSDFLARADRVTCKRGLSKRLQEKISTHSQEVSDAWKSIWGTAGDPNMLQVASQDLALQGFQIVVEGVDLYVGSNLYAKDVQWEIGETVRPQFFTCFSFVQHNAAMNFIVMKALVSGGWVIGNDDFLKVTRLELSTYLRLLDENLGRGRK